MLNQHSFRIGQFCFCLLAAVIVCADQSVPTTVPAEIDPANPPLGIFSDEWYTVMLNGKKCGQMHTRMERKKENIRDTIHTWTKMKLRVRRNQIEIGLGIDQKTQETLDGRPLSYSQTQYLGNNPVVTEATFKNKKVTITTTQFGTKSEPRTYTLPERAMLDWAIYREQFKYNLKAGTKYELPVYDPSLSPDRTMPTTVEILGPEVVDLFGRKVEAVKTRQTLRLSGAGGGTDLETLGWVTKAGAPVRLQMKIMDIPIELLACPKTVAMAEDDPAELMVNMLVPLNRPINAEQARKLTYKVGLKKGAKGKLPDFPETTIQKVITKSENEITLQITRPSALPKNKVKADLTSEQRREYLAATATVNYKDPEVAKLAKQATGKEKDPRQMAENLCRYVSDHIQSKTLGVGFATASEVARSREGDCTEHGVLLAALGRAKGIPTRLVTGLVHADNFGGKANVLAGHLWTQFWIDGEWVDLDAALRQTDVDPTHIAMAITSAGDSGIADLVTSTWLNLGQFEMTVTESK